MKKRRVAGVETLENPPKSPFAKGGFLDYGNRKKLSLRAQGAWQSRLEVASSSRNDLPEAQDRPTSSIDLALQPEIGGLHVGVVD
jgi:hypothetical protein